MIDFCFYVYNLNGEMVPRNRYSNSIRRSLWILKIWTRIHKEQAERQKFKSILQRFEEGSNVRNGFIVIAIVIVLVIVIYGLKEMNFLFESIPGGDPVEQVTPRETEGE